MWRCDLNPTIGTTESRLLESVEPLWKTHSAPKTGWKILPRVSQKRVESHLHHMIKSALQSPLSWWQIAPLFSLPLSVYNLRYVFMVCNRLLQTHTHKWIPQKFIVQHAPTLCVLACANQNWSAAHQYRKFIPTNLTRVKVVNALCELNGYSNELKSIVESLLQEHPVENSCYPFFTNCLRNTSPLSNVVSEQMKISSFDWRCALQMVCEQWTEAERTTGLRGFVDAIQQQCHRHGCDAFVSALNDEIVSLKYRCTTLPVGWVRVLEAVGHNGSVLFEHCYFKAAPKLAVRECNMFITLALHCEDVVCEGLLRLVAPSSSSTFLFTSLMENNLLAAAQMLLKIAPVTCTRNYSLCNTEDFPYLHSWILKHNIAQNIPSDAQTRIRKL